MSKLNSLPGSLQGYILVSSFSVSCCNDGRSATSWKTAVSISAHARTHDSRCHYTKYVWCQELFRVRCNDGRSVISSWKTALQHQRARTHARTTRVVRTLTSTDNNNMQRAYLKCKARAYSITRGLVVHLHLVVNLLVVNLDFASSTPPSPRGCFPCAKNDTG